MVNDIIKTFERKFNKFADTTHAFTTRFIRDEDSAIGTLCFNGYNVEFEYCLECGGTVEKSGLNIIVDFSKRRQTPLRCMMYDVVTVTDETNFDCWFYCFIENESRMELCFDKLSSDFMNIKPQIDELVSDGKKMDLLEAVVQKNILTMVGVDIKKELGGSSDDDIDVDETYNYLFNMYFSFVQCAFASDEYRDFLGGDFKKALKKYEKKKKLLAYEERIISHIESGAESKPIIAEEYECLKDGLKSYKGVSGFIPFAVSTCILLIPFLVVCVGGYYAISVIMYRTMLYSTVFELYNALACIIPAFISSIVAGYFMRDRVYSKFFKVKYAKMKDYEDIFYSGKSRRRMKVFCYLIYLVILIFVFLTAHNGFAMSESGINYTDGIFDIKGKGYSYSDVRSVSYKIDNGKPTGYQLNLSDGTEVWLGHFADDNDVEKHILPILSNNGIEIVEEKL